MKKNSTRREFFRHTTVAAIAAGFPTIASGKTREQARNALARRQRRIIFNDAGDDGWHPDAATPEGFVGVRLKHMLDTQVDTLFYCTTQSFNYFTHKTEVGEVFLNREGPFANNNMQALLDQGTDPLKIAINFAHANGIEAIWTLRMNDIHDAFTPQLWPQWKTDHPDALLGKREDWAANEPGSQARWWAGVDFSRADVRQRTIALIKEVAENYDVDGIDLDWLRHPIHFPETVGGKAATQAEIDLLTGLMREVRTMLEGIGKERGRPILLATRVALTRAQGRYMGTDISAWLDEGLVDFVTIGGGYVPFSMPTAEVAELCQQHGVPAYPCISASGMTRRAPYGKGKLYGIEAWRATAANAFAQGAAGVSLFNLFPSPGDERHNAMVRQAFSELGAADTLAGKDKLFCLDNEAHMKTHGYINHVVPHAKCLPKPLTKSTATTIEIPVSDVPAAGKAELRLQVDGECAPSIRVNGQAVVLTRNPELEESIGLFWLTGPVPLSMVRVGANKIEGILGADASSPVQLTGAEIRIQYA
ncbi:MAG: family 10 glycosylhydrolase [Candidatus Hydrogenedentes bacterium]|nr:family 10 glycosylhydrolase [Candidatus Hydrogenedentota bacterium]